MSTLKRWTGSEWEYVGPGVSGASVTGLGDYGRWHRDGGPVDATSGSFDFTVDLADSLGTSIAVDSSSAWITSVAGWGWAVPRVTVAGLYLVKALIPAGAGMTSISGSVVFVDDGGNNIAPWNAEKPTLGWHGTSPAAADAARFDSTLYLPAGAHFDFGSLSLAGGDPNSMDLYIQHVG